MFIDKRSKVVLKYYVCYDSTYMTTWKGKITEMTNWPLVASIKGEEGNSLGNFLKQ